MTERIKRMRVHLMARDYRKEMTYGTEPLPPSSEASFAEVTDVFVKMMEMQSPKLYPDDRFGFNFTYSRPQRHARFGNLTPNHEYLLRHGLSGILSRIAAAKERADAEGKAFLEAGERSVHGALALAERYRRYAALAGAEELAFALEQVPYHGARNLYEALLMIKFLHFTLRLSDGDHIGLGRMDQYLLPYYASETKETALELIEEFFISLNRDSYLYNGMQQGDNGQSLMLGGYNSKGEEQFNELSEVILTASLELNLIDPKINLRVSKNTSEYIYRLGTKLTKLGLGFPQYCNDDVVVPALIKLGYEPEDAYDYTVAACWEVIIPGKGADFPNRSMVVFPALVRQVMMEHLPECENYEQLLSLVDSAIAEECTGLINRYDQWMTCAPYPYFSLFIDPCIERGRDATHRGAKYCNFGFHGVGISDGANALYAVKRAVFEDKIVSAEQLLAAMERNFEGDTALQNTLRSYPKMGDNDDGVDVAAAALMASYSRHMNGRKNLFGSICRAGTGSAMEYVRASKHLGATAEGRAAGFPFSCSFSPALNSGTKGPLSVIASFTKHPLTEICNGGPLTMELHHNIFRNEIGEEKVARMVQTFVQRGGHQLQLNAIHPERLQAALEHPEEHRELIVRVWGWSGRFIELDPAYQQHIIKRTSYNI